MFSLGASKAPVNLQWGQWHTPLIPALKTELGQRDSPVIGEDPVSSVNLKSTTLSSHNPKLAASLRRKGFEKVLWLSR